jgi:putative transposase
MWKNGRRQRGSVVTYETVRQWCLKLGQAYPTNFAAAVLHVGTRGIRTRVFLTIKGKRSSLWRAVDQHGNVLDILVQSRRNTYAAKRFFRKLLKGLHYAPRVIMTDKLKRDASGETRDPAWRGASAAQRIEQSRGKLAPTFAPTREENAALHISQTRAPLPLSFRPHLWPFPTTKTPFVCWGIPNSFTGPIPAME